MIFLTNTEAILAAKGELTAIVRVIKPQPKAGCWSPSNGSRILKCPSDELNGFSPFGKPGSIVPAKETWGIEDGTWKIYYKADYDNFSPCMAQIYSWRSPITMPAAAVRHRFLIKSVKVMRAVDIQTKVEKEVFHCKSSHDFWKQNRIKDPKQWCWITELEESCPPAL